jgi:hypothetical protein
MPEEEHCHHTRTRTPVTTTATTVTTTTVTTTVTTAAASTAAVSGGASHFGWVFPPGGAVSFWRGCLLLVALLVLRFSFVPCLGLLAVRFLLP